MSATRRSHEIRASVPERREGPRRARLGAARSPSTRACAADDRLVPRVPAWAADERRRPAARAAATDLRSGALASATRRWPTRCSTEAQLGDAGADAIPLDLVLLPGLLARADHRDGAARDAVPRLPLLLVVLRHDARARARRSRRASSPQRGLGADSLVVEVASNDGYLLAVLPARRRAGARHRARAGTSPQVAEERGIPHDRRVLRRGARAPSSSPRGSRADVFHANNVLAHVADLNGFVEGIAHRARRRRRGGRSRCPTSRT